MKKMKKKLLRVLVVDDSQDDTLLLTRELNQGEWDIDVFRVDTREDMERALHERTFNIVICDFVIPRFGGMEALSLFNTFHLDISFIMISGKITEEMAVEALIQGAQDFILKQNYARLLPAIRRGIEKSNRIATQKKIDHSLIESEIKLSKITEVAQDAIVMIDNEGSITFWRGGAQRIFGYTEAEAMGQNLHQLIAPMRYHAAHHKGFAHFQNTGEGAAIGKTLELVALHKDGHEIPVELSLSAVKINELWCGVGIVRDISERKEADQALKRSMQLHTLLFESSRDALMILSPPSWKFTGANQETVTLFGASSVSEFTTLGPWDVSPQYQPNGRPSDEMAQQEIATAMREGAAFFEWEHQKLNGEKFFADVLLTRMEIEGGNSFLQASVRDISERKKAEETLHKSLISTVEAMVITLEMRDPYTAGHQKRVAFLACAIAKKMGMAKNQIEGLKLAAQVHDIGKIQIPAEILSKPSVLSEIEFLLIKVHPEVGYEILKDIQFPWPIATIVRQHHEKLDGSGYPHGLKRDEILLEARILCVADIVEAMTNHRPYRPALGIDAALEEIQKERGIKLESDAVDACIALFKEEGFRFPEKNSSLL